MGFQNREIEKKLYTEDLTLAQVAELLDQYALKYQSTNFLAGTGTDYYWDVPNRPDAFYRIRERDGVRQLTYKEEDRGDSFDRFEGDLSCFSPLQDCIEVAEKQYGSMKGQIFKFFYVHFFNNCKWDTVCCYTVKVNGQADNRVYVEVEGQDPVWVMAHVSTLKSVIPGLKPAEGSLNTIYFKAKP